MDDSSRPQFATTQWTLVWQAADEANESSRPAVEEVISRYWMPLYSFARGKGLSREDAEDATQEFLTDVVNGNLLNAADPARGKFRSFLLTAWSRYLVDVYRKKTAQKRGGNKRLVSLNFDSGEQQWSELQSTHQDPDQAFMAAWANNLLAQVKAKLSAENTDAFGQPRPLFALLKGKLTQPCVKADYEKIGEQVNLTPNAVKVALHRLRKRFGEILRELVRETLDDDAEANIDAEINELLAALQHQPSMESS